MYGAKECRAKYWKDRERGFYSRKASSSSDDVFQYRYTSSFSSSSRHKYRSPKCLIKTSIKKREHLNPYYLGMSTMFNYNFLISSPCGAPRFNKSPKYLQVIQMRTVHILSPPSRSSTMREHRRKVQTWPIFLQARFLGFIRKFAMRWAQLT